MLAPNSPLGLPTFPSSETTFPSLWDFHEPSFVFHPEPKPEHTVSEEPHQEQVASKPAGSNNTNNPTPQTPNSGSEEPKQNKTNSNSSSDDQNPAIDEKKRRRMLSNRESARRSRMRKQKHIENLRYQANWIMTRNRDLTNQLRFVKHHCQVVRRENDRLRLESAVLQQRLWDIYQVLRVRELQQQLYASSSAAASFWPCNNNLMAINKQTL